MSSSSQKNAAALQKLKRKQIEKLKQNKYREFTEVQRDIQYRIAFKLKKDGNDFQMLIQLPPNFPIEAPLIFIHPVCSHKYIDAAQQVFNFPSLQNFKKKPDLVYVVNKLISEFEKNPPIKFEIGSYYLQAQIDAITKVDENVSVNENAESLLPGCSASNMLSQTLSRENSIITKKVKYSAPTIPEHFKELDGMEPEELTEIITDETKLIDLFHTVEQAKKLVEDREELSSKIQKLATSNLSRSSEVEQWRENLVQAHEKCLTLQNENSILEEKYDDEAERYTPNNISILLKVSIAETDQQSESIVDKFLSGNENVSTFIKHYMETKTVYHRRKIIEDKISLIAKTT